MSAAMGPAVCPPDGGPSAASDGVWARASTAMTTTAASVATPIQMIAGETRLRAFPLELRERG